MAHHKCSVNVCYYHYFRNKESRVSLTKLNCFLKETASDRREDWVRFTGLPSSKGPVRSILAGRIQLDSGGTDFW